MTTRPYLPALLSVVTLAFLAMSCGSNSNSDRFLRSITVTPATADAQSFPGGQVQFTATGTFTMPPSPDVLTFSSPYTGSFTVDDAGIATIVSSSGGTVTVKCAAGASGSTNVTALACAFAKGTAATCVPVKGIAQLSCP